MYAENWEVIKSKYIQKHNKGMLDDIDIEMSRYENV